jgi:hypothetical protein
MFKVMGGACLLPAEAWAQKGELTADTLMKIISDPAAIEQLLEEMDALTAVLARAEARRAGSAPPPNARAIYFELRRQIAIPDNRAGIMSALTTPEGQNRALQLTNALGAALKLLPSLLTEAGLRSGAPLIEELVSAFRTFTQLINVKTNSDGWWCKCYGLGKLC